MTAQNILVTGGAGYIGSHAVRRLIELGHRVTVVDDLSHGHRAAVDPKAGFHRMSLADQDGLRALLKQEKIEAVLHFAAWIEVGESGDRPADYYRNNVANSLSLLEAMIACDVSRLIFSSTAAVYGDPTSTPIAENHACRPINVYGRTKHMVETILSDIAKAHGLGYVALRYFNVAGASEDARIGEAHEPESHLIPRLLMTALQGGSAKIFGADYPTPDGTCIRDYVHVLDLVEAHVLALSKAQRGGGGHIYNLGSESGFSVREVIRACERVSARPIPAVEESRRAGDPAVLLASSEKIRNELAWRPKHAGLETMIRHAWEWHRSSPDGYRSKSL